MNDLFEKKVRSAAVAGWWVVLIALGLLPEQSARLNDDRCGGALDHLFRAERASLLTAVALRTIRAFQPALDALHQDTTTVTLSGEFADQPPAAQAERPARITH